MQNQLDKLSEAIDRELTEKQNLKCCGNCWFDKRGSKCGKYHGVCSNWANDEKRATERMGV